MPMGTSVTEGDVTVRSEGLGHPGEKKKKRIQKLLQILKRKKIKVKQTVSNAKP